MGETMEKMIEEIIGWLVAAKEKILHAQNDQLTVAEKTNRKDLVTNMDREIQAFLINKIHSAYPQAKILAEEEGYNNLSDLSGQVFIIDPIDGTLNFVVQGENFCIMLAYYEDGVGQLGFIYDVMRDELYWGGKTIGVYKNDVKLPQPQDLPLDKGLIAINSYLFGHDRFNIHAIGEQSIGVRMCGCAGLELIAMLKGNHIGYISNLSPWDYAAGNVLLEEFGMRYSGFSGAPLTFSGREYYLAATPTAYETILDMLQLD